MAKKQPIVPMVENDWATGISSAPVFIDGLSNSLHYLIVATRTTSDKYSIVAIGRFSQDLFKVKFYGSFEEWGFNEHSLDDKFRARDFLSRADEPAGYERYYTDREGVRRIVKALSQTRNVTVGPLDGIFSAFDIPYEQRAETSKLAHPKRGGERPLLPFKQLMLLGYDAVAA